MFTSDYSVEHETSGQQPQLVEPPPTAVSIA